MARPRKPESELKRPRRITFPDGTAIRPKGRPRKDAPKIIVVESKPEPVKVKPLTEAMIQLPVEQLKRIIDPSPQPLPPDADVVISSLTPLEYALQVMNDPREPKERRDRLCVAAMPFVHTKKGEGGKREAAAEKANKAASQSKFATPSAPKLKAVS